ncbi:MAG: SpoIIE family protein phosphatase [Bacteroidales bacterium]|nr:SpoIIE family protein phosphatase [Bacteroidales bacterium]
MTDTLPYYVEVSNAQRYYEGQYICGDVFLSKRLKTQNRILSVLSDGMGHGVKANVLATLTAHMSLNFAEEHRDASTIAQIIMDTLPICSERHTSYATFTIVDIANGKVSILEYDNPTCLIMRGGNIYEPEWQQVQLENVDHEGRSRTLHTCEFVPMKEDRIIYISDGVTQSGMGSDKWPFGWQRENYVEYVRKSVLNDRYIPAGKLAQRVVDMAHTNDNFDSKDDTSCGVIYFRDARQLIIATGPPVDEKSDKDYVERVMNFNGKKILCGATTSEIFSRELNREITDNYDESVKGLPPCSSMEGVDLITEGVLTLSKVETILNKITSTNSPLGNSPADKIVALLMDSDRIKFLVGTKINQDHHDATMPVVIEIRRTLIMRIASILENKFIKEVEIEFI